MFPTPFFDEIIKQFTDHEFYSFIDGFSGYNQVPIAKEDQPKMTFVFEFGSFSYKVIQFWIMNASTLFSIIVVKSFQEYIYKTMVVYLYN
jgi:large-conductance mechanosensitive channel